MERIKDLNRYQKGILLALCAMLVIFLVSYFMVTSRVGYAYMDSILCPTEQDGSTVYSGTIDGKEASFTVTSDKTVTFRWGDRLYGPYVARVDPSAVPKGETLSGQMTGLEILDGEQVFFRGGVFKNGDYFLIYNEDGSADMGVIITASNGIVVDSDGNVVDTMEPRVSAILHLMEGPELTHKGTWLGWFLGVFMSVVTVISMLFADEIFRWNLAFQIRGADYVDPSDWEIAGRYIGWTGLTIAALVFYINGLQ